MGKPKSTNSNDVKSNEPSGFTLTITPYTALTLLALFTAILFSWDQYRGSGDVALCNLIKGDYEEKTEWITAPDHKNKEDYLKYEQGTFIYRHIFMEDFDEVFGVKPIYFPVRKFFILTSTDK
jgi:hypothetical protein